MQSDFELSCKSARDAIAVPAFPLDAIHDAVHDRPSRRTGGRRRVAVAAVVAGLSIAAAATAAEVLGHLQITLTPSGEVRMYFDGKNGYRGPIRNPKEADFEAAARAMNFPVVFPKGLPKGTTAEGMTVAAPGAIQIAYNLPGAWRRDNHLLFVILANPKSVTAAGGPPPRTNYSLQYGRTTSAGAMRWMVGQEEVIVLKSTMTPSELAHFKAAMNAR
jgi:hypothetical protein